MSPETERVLATAAAVLVALALLCLLSPLQGSLTALALLLAHGWAYPMDDGPPASGAA